MTAVLRFLAPSSIRSNEARAVWSVVAAGQGLLLWAIGLNWWQVVVCILSGRFFASIMTELEHR